ncbi:helix-turn-helix domain-containing protein [Bacillus sp. DTU_2020_1000418_1_SI_GHA_SEK_038]|uniref:helix-turn-helix domain-containing protein n=1 Tax=Bacillus sp. DTU_2020_1000418_1_SI_GHA_SEK_038 TaxID=3077585 RepID=UPI0028EB56C2|nr:helix-turn-helix domain-containing protein [Bacillus sp. DTU_2020_1000418_1_SI_GHA_SEK_038]WNS76597.1 helix-turn-helix domain-containing protein [Bacillus sp. DTU_2020_1000418_1_SI_GHA_SEK_038]
MIKQQLFTFLQNKFNNNPYKIYFSEKVKQRTQLLHSHGEMAVIDIPFLTNPSKKKYLVQPSTNNSLYTFFYSGNDQVHLYLSNPAIHLSKNELDELYILFSVVGLENKISAKEIELTSMIESTLSITASLELDEVLDKIVSHALSVIPAADAGFVQLANDRTQELTVRSAIGFNKKLKAIRVKFGESITGRVYKDGNPVIYFSKSEIYEGMETLSMSNFTNIRGASDHSKLKSLISVPLKLDNQPIGVMTVHQYEAEGKLTEDNLRLLEGFGAQAAIAIQNARLYQEKNEQLEEIIELTKRLEEKNSLLLRRAEIHENLTRLSLQNKSVEYIIRELNRMMSSEVFFFDNLDSELFPKKTVHYPYLSNDEFAEILRYKTKPFFIDINDEKEMKYYVYPILTDRVSLGCFIIPFLKPISPQDKMTIEQASYVLALELTKQKTQAEVYYKKTKEIFNDLLNNKEPLVMEEIGEALGLNTNSFFSVLLLEIVSYTDLQILEAVIHRLISRIKRRIPEKGTLVYGFHNKVTILFSTNHPNEIDEVGTMLDSLLLKWGNQENIPLYAGLSSSYKGIHAISKCYDEAKKALAYIINRHKTGIMNYKKMGINRLFLAQPSPEIEQFANDILAPLRSEKAQNNDLEKTLFTYVRLNKSIVETSERLHVHKNTLYHRIKRIEELLQLDFNDPDDYLQILLACHLYENFPKNE